MSSRFTDLVVDCYEPERLAQFWGVVLDYEVTESSDNDVYIEGPEGSGPGLLFQKVPEPKRIKNRAHIDISPRDREQQEEVERILELGRKDGRPRAGGANLGRDGRPRR